MRGRRVRGTAGASRLQLSLPRPKTGGTVGAAVAAVTSTRLSEAGLYFAFIYELKNWRPRRCDAWQPFKGEFLLDPLRASTASCDLGPGDGWSAQVLQFFREVPAGTRTLAIVTADAPASIDEQTARSFLASQVGKASIELLGRVAWFTGPLAGRCEEASRFLRDSKTLAADDFMALNALRVAADGKGLAVVDTSEPAPPAGDRFRRATQVVALSCAYGAMLEALLESLSRAGLMGGKAAEQALRDWSRFMSAYYFSEPVRQRTIELCHFYRAVRERQKLDVLVQEATEQLRLLAELVRLDRNEAQAGRERRRQLLLGLAGLVFAALGAIQVTPKTMVDFRDAWSACRAEWGLWRCISGERPVAAVPAPAPTPAAGGKRPPGPRAAASKPVPQQPGA